MATSNSVDAKKANGGVTLRNRLAWIIPAAVGTAGTLTFVGVQNATRVLCGSPLTLVTRNPSTGDLESTWVCPFDPYRYIPSLVLLVVTVALVVLAARPNRTPRSRLAMQVLAWVGVVLVPVAMLGGLGAP